MRGKCQFSQNSTHPQLPEELKKENSVCLCGLWRLRSGCLKPNLCFKPVRSQIAKDKLASQKSREENVAVCNCFLKEPPHTTPLHPLKKHPQNKPTVPQAAVDYLCFQQQADSFTCIFCFSLCTHFFSIVTKSSKLELDWKEARLYIWLCNRLFRIHLLIVQHQGCGVGLEIH